VSKKRPSFVDKGRLKYRNREVVSIAGREAQRQAALKKMMAKAMEHFREVAEAQEGNE
jgi:hypothetical protein